MIAVLLFYFHVFRPTPLYSACFKPCCIENVCPLFRLCLHISDRFPNQCLCLITCRHLSKRNLKERLHASFTSPEVLFFRRLKSIELYSCGLVWVLHLHSVIHFALLLASRSRCFVACWLRMTLSQILKMKL